MPTAFAKRRIGRTSLEITELGFGAAALGNLYQPVSGDVAAQTLSCALDLGLHYVDTAPYYGFGLSERRVGDGVRDRTDIVVSTKVGRRLTPDPQVADDRERFGFRSPMPFAPVYDYSYDGILRSYEDSLQRLGLARVDILYVHDIGRLTHGDAEEVHFDALTRGGGLRCLAELRASSRISAFGIGVNEIEACLRVMDCAQLDVILLAGRYTLLEQGALTELFPRCAATQTSVVIGGPYNSGILATGTKGRQRLRYDYGDPPENVIHRVAAIERLCEEHGVPLAAAALQFPLAHPQIASVIPGLDSAERVSETAELYQVVIPDEFWSRLLEQGLIDPAAPVPPPR